MLRFVLSFAVATHLLVAQVRITVDEDALHFVSFEEISRHLELTPQHRDHLRLSRDGSEVPILVQGASGRIDPGDGIVFYGQKRQGPFSKRQVYVLDLAARPRRLRESDEARPLDAAKEATVRVLAEQDDLFSALPTIDPSASAEACKDPWYWKALSAPQRPRDSGAREVFPVTLPSTPLPTASRLRIHFVGPTVSLPQEVAVRLNDTDLEPVRWSGALAHVAEFRVPAGTLRPLSLVSIENRSAVARYDEPGNELGKNRSNTLLVQRIELEARVLLNGSSDERGQRTYRLLHGDADRAASYGFNLLNRSGQYLYHHESGVLSRSSTVFPRSDAAESLVVCASYGSLVAPRLVERMTPTRAHQRAEPADYIVVTTDRFAPFLAPLVDHRRSRGLVPLVVTARELYDAFTHGNFDPEAIPAFLRAATKTWARKPLYLLLVGDSDRGVDFLSQKEVLPCAMVLTAYNGLTAADAPLGDLDGDGVPDLAVGRLPVRSETELFEVIARIRALEREPQSGSWRRTVRFLTGEPRFSPAVDGLLERVTRSTIEGTLPPAFLPRVTSATADSPFAFPAPSFEDEVVRQWNEGAIAVAYAGHANATDLDWIQRDGARYPMLRSSRVGELNAGPRNPVVALIACSAGEFDRPEKDALGELLLRRAGGAAAVIASTRVSHPLPNVMFGQALLSKFFEPGRRLGDSFLAAQLALVGRDDFATAAMLTLGGPFLSPRVDVARLRRDHVNLYVLLGDPAFEPPIPRDDLTLIPPGVLRPGSTIDISGTSPRGGMLTISLDRVPGALASGSSKTVDHAGANAVTIAESSGETSGGQFRRALQLPASLTGGTYLIRAYLAETGGKDAAAALHVAVRVD